MKIAPANKLMELAANKPMHLQTCKRGPSGHVCKFAGDLYVSQNKKSCHIYLAIQYIESTKNAIN